MLTGKGMRALQEAGVLDIDDAVLPRAAVARHLRHRRGAGRAGLVLLLLIASALWPIVSARFAKDQPQPAQ